MADSTYANGKSTNPGDLAVLTAALDSPGTDLRDALGAFADNLTGEVPSLLGVMVTVVVDGVVVTLNVHAADAPRPKASLNVPFSALVPDAMDGTMMFYAADVGAFADLAALVSRSASVSEQVPAAGQRVSLRSGPSPRVRGLAEFCVRNQAIGVLIDQGYTPDEARIELTRRANRDEATLSDTAQLILDHLAATTNRAAAARAQTPRTWLSTRRKRTRAAPGADLTARERDVLRLLITGLSTAAIAADLLVLPGTVSDHINSIMTKLGAHNRVETVAISVSANVLGTG